MTNCTIKKESTLHLLCGCAEDAYETTERLKRFALTVPGLRGGSFVLLRGSVCPC